MQEKINILLLRVTLTNVIERCRCKYYLFSNCVIPFNHFKSWAGAAVMESQQNMF